MLLDYSKREKENVEKYIWRNNNWFFLKHNENSINLSTRNMKKIINKVYLKLLKTSNKFLKILKWLGHGMEGPGRGGHIIERNKGDGNRFCLKQCKSEDSRATSLKHWKRKLPKFYT